MPDTASPGQPVDLAAAATATQAQSSTPAHSAGAQAGLGAVAGMPVPAPVAAAATVSGTPAPGQPAPFPAAPHEQVFTALSPLIRGADGSYGVKVQLHPNDLGAVQVVVDVRHGVVSLQMHSTDAAARDALRGGMPDLRQQLEDSGLRAGSMEVGSGGANAQQPQTPWSRPPDIETPSLPPIPSDPLVAAAGTASSTNLDLRM